jgi:hypothetical protein
VSNYARGLRIEVDVLTLLAPGEAIPPPVLAALGDQGAVNLHHHLVRGGGVPGEKRVDTIARARNAAKRHARARFSFFLDRDVVLPPLGIEKLAFGLALNPHHAALGINYQEACASPAPHVAMGAVLFHTEVLQQLDFRSQPGCCECSCCCYDVRQLGYEIDYLPGLRAHHLKA